ncbi:MAG TPA: DsbA family protein [Xanthobacteraceae bacterium]
MSVIAIGTAAPAAALDAKDRKEIEAIIKDYLLKNPTVLRDAIMALQRQEAESDAKERAVAVKENEKLIYESPRGVVVGNRSGDVTLVEFFDYNCGYCKRALEDMNVLMKADSKLKFVLKEFPVLGQGSLEAAKVAIAVRMQDKDGTKYLDFHRRLLAGRGEANNGRALAAAKDAGLDMAQIEKDLKSAEIDATLLESAKLADALGISGTPSYVIGGEVVPGAVGAAALKKRVDAVRKCGVATC